MAPKYGPKIYRAQGATEMVVASGGQVRVESGGAVTFESGGNLKLPVVTASSLTDLTPGAVNIVAPTTNAVYKLPAITAGMPGQVCYITKAAATTVLTATIQQATTSLFFGGAIRLCVLSANFESLQVVAGSTTDLSWHPIGGTIGSTVPWSTA